MVKDGTKVIYGPDEVLFKEAPSTLYAADGSWSNGEGPTRKKQVDSHAFTGVALS